MSGRVITTLAAVSALAVAPLAHAQSGFPDYRQAAADQYPTQPPPADQGSGSSQGTGSSQGNGQNPQTGGSSGSARPAHTAHGHTTPGSRGSASAGTAGTGAAPVAVSSAPVPASKGSLPFTGSDLSGLVVLALVLIAAGLFFGAVARATRHRRRHAPAG